MSWGAHKYNDGIDINNCKRYREATSTHHRKPRSIGGTNENRNLIELRRGKHASWHNLFQNWSVERIAYEINLRYLDPDYELLVKKKG